MASTARSNVRRRIRVAVSAAAAFTVLTASAAGASPKTPFGVAAAGLAWLGADTALGPVPGARPGTGPRSPQPGFLLDRGRYTAFDTPDPAVFLAPTGINNRGQISGEYLPPGSESGFLRDGRGRITKIDIPGATATEVVKINDRGVIAGAYSQRTPTLSDPNAMAHGFLLDRGTVTTIDAPGAVQTEAAGVNDRGQVVGISVDAADTPHGFLWHEGRFAAIDVPGAPITLASGINNGGQIVGSTLTDVATFAGACGFLLGEGVDGPVTRIDFPGAPRTLAAGINDRGQIVGAYENPNTTPSP